MKEYNLDNDTKIDSGFKLPDNYFEQFEEKIMKQLPQKNTKVISLNAHKHLWISTIAAVFLLAIAIPVYFNLAKTTSVENSTIETYLSHEYSTADITEQLTISDIETLENDLALNDQVIEDYLIDNQNLDYYLNE
jgi:hypothetical protein